MEAIRLLHSACAPPVGNEIDAPPGRRSWFFFHKSRLRRALIERRPAGNISPQLLGGRWPGRAHIRIPRLIMSLIACIVTSLTLFVGTYRISPSFKATSGARPFKIKFTGIVMASFLPSSRVRTSCTRFNAEHGSPPPASANASSTVSVSPAIQHVSSQRLLTLPTT